MIQVVDGEIKQYKLPKVGILQSGETISGYNLLSEEILLSEGWLPLEDVKPVYDLETQYIQPTGYEIQADKVVKKYEVKEISSLPITMEDEIISLKNTIKSLIRVDKLTEDELMEMINIYPKWENLLGTFIEKDKYLQYDGKLYKVIKGLTLQKDWKPNEVASEFTPVFPENIIAEWVQPSGDTGNYVLGSIVIHNGQTWESTHDGNNVWEPGVYGWVAL